MKILAIGANERIADLSERLKGNNRLSIEKSDGNPDEDFKEYDVIFDLNADDSSENLEQYAALKNKPVFLCAVKESLAEMAYINNVNVKCKLFGINALPGFLSLEKWEISLYRKFEGADLDKLMNELKVPFDLVEDRVGMVSPRVISMIINEACYTMQEGTAGMEDIDLGMKLGTNYPKGPLEWADQIGVTDVFETLSALYEDTKEERYKVCPLLKNKYLRNQSFYKA